MSKRYEYKYVRVKLKGGGFSGRFSAEYQNEIKLHANEGWRFVQAFAPAIVGYGASSYTDLIFERELN
jgi:hypothetical protein